MEKLAAVTGNSDFIHMHVDDQMDAKSLLGAYVCSTVPGEFVWQPGPLTQVLPMFNPTLSSLWTYLIRAGAL